MDGETNRKREKIDRETDSWLDKQNVTNRGA
jgi:hypothetical protein